MEVQTYTTADIYNMNPSWIPVFLAKLGLQPTGVHTGRGRIVEELNKRGLILDPPIEVPRPLNIKMMSDTGRIKMVVNMTVEDGDTYSYGIVGNITEEQKDVLFSAAGSHGSDRAMRVMRYNDRTSDISFEADQIISLHKDNWPKYPVLTITFMTWS